MKRTRPWVSIVDQAEQAELLGRRRVHRQPVRVVDVPLRRHHRPVAVRLPHGRVAEEDVGGTVFCAGFGTGYADGFVETPGVGACRINDPTGDRDVGAAICREGEAGCSEEDRS